MEQSEFRKATAAAKQIDEFFSDYCKPGAGPVDPEEMAARIQKLEYGPQVIALLVKHNDWDGRISLEAKNWANTITPERLDFERGQTLYHRLHMCHLDAIARHLDKNSNNR